VSDWDRKLFRVSSVRPAGDLEQYEAWVRIGNKNSFVKTYPPPVPDIEAAPLMVREAQKPYGDTVNEKAKVNFLRDCWFSC